MGFSALRIIIMLWKNVGRHCERRSIKMVGDNKKIRLTVRRWMFIIKSICVKLRWWWKMTEVSLFLRVICEDDQVKRLRNVLRETDTFVSRDNPSLYTYIVTKTSRGVVENGTCSPVQEFSIAHFIFCQSQPSK